MYCQQCGTENDDNAYRCVDCGEFLHADSRAPGVIVRQNSGLAVGSMISSIAGLFLCFFVGQIVGLVLGYKARQQIAESDGMLQGEGMATAGIIIGWIGIGIDVIFVIGYIAFFATAMGDISFP